MSRKYDGKLPLRVTRLRCLLGPDLGAVHGGCEVEDSVASQQPNEVCDPANTTAARLPADTALDPTQSNIIV